MGSNINEKNLIYGFKTYEDLPYHKYDELGLNTDSNNLILNSTSMNSIYNAMVENDLVAAESIIDKKNVYVSP